MLVKCQNCGKYFDCPPSYIKKGVKNCHSCRGAHFRKQYYCDNKRYKEFYNKYKNLIHWKALEVAKDNNKINHEIYEELISRYLFALLRFASKNSEEFKPQYFNSVLKYETDAYIKEIKNEKINIIYYNEDEEWKIENDFISIDNIDDKIDGGGYLNSVLNYLYSNNYKELIMLSMGYSCKEISRVVNRTGNGVSNAITRQRNMLKRYYSGCIDCEE